MYQSLELFPGVRLRCIHSSRFKQGVLSVQFLRPMERGEAALNALLPDILLRGCVAAPDLQQITARLDDLYGASVAAQVRRIGDYQTTGLACGFIDDRFALPGDRVLEPMVGFLGQLLLQPVTEKDGFCREYVSGEKKNLISALEAQLSDKAAYAAGKLLKNMCRGDSFAVPRLGGIAQVRKVTARGLYTHYQKVLRESPVEIFYVGSADLEQVAALLRPIFARLPREEILALPPQTALNPAKPSHKNEKMDISQAKLAMGFVTDITNRDARFAAMQLFNTVFGAGMTSKLFVQLREKQGLCYAIGSSYYAGKGLFTVNAGIDSARVEETKTAVLAQLRACQAGDITQQELENAKAAVLSSLRAVYDGPGAMESFFSTMALSGLDRSPERYAQEIQAVALEDVVAAAETLRFHSSYFLTGEGQDE
jgi:predicted Zn-dependent peptidase